MRNLILLLAFVLIPSFLSCNNQETAKDNGSANAVENGEINSENLKKFFMNRYSAQLPNDTKVEVGSIEDSALQGFKKGTFEIDLQSRGNQSLPFMVSKDGRYVILGSGDAINLDELEESPIKGLKKGTINVGRPMPILITEDGKQLVVGELVDTTVDPFQEVKDKISMDNVPMKGSKDAKVTVVEYSDFQCPFCKKGKDMLPQLLEEYDGKINVVFKQMPLANHNWAKAAAVASLCSYEQGNENFWTFHDSVFDKQKEIQFSTADKQFKDIAKEIGLNLDEFNKCIESDDINARVQADIQEAQSIGVNSTPTFVVNGVIVPGANLQGIKNAIEGRLSNEG